MNRTYESKRIRSEFEERTSAGFLVYGVLSIRAFSAALGRGKEREKVCRNLNKSNVGEGYLIADVGMMPGHIRSAGSSASGLERKLKI